MRSSLPHAPAILATLALIAGACTLALGLNDLSPLLPLGAFLILIVALILGVIVITHVTAPKHRPIPCPRCEYDLSGLARRGRCPECGSPYNLDQPAEAPPSTRA